DRAARHGLVDQVRAALVVEADAGDLDLDAVDLAAAVRPGVEAVHVVAGQLAVERHLPAEQQLRVQAEVEAHRERAELVRLGRGDPAPRGGGGGRRPGGG